MRKNGPIFGNWVQRNAFLVIAIVKHFYDNDINKKKWILVAFLYLRHPQPFNFIKLLFIFSSLTKRSFFLFLPHLIGDTCCWKIVFKSFKSLRPSRKCRELIGWYLISLRFIAQLSHWMETMKPAPDANKTMCGSFHEFKTKLAKNFSKHCFLLVAVFTSSI